MKTVIDQMLVKAGAYFGGEGVIYANFDPKKFAELVRANAIADEREACAKDVEAAYTLGLPYDDVATAIRARTTP